MKTIFSFLICTLLLSAQAQAVGPIVISGTGNPASNTCVKLNGTEVGVLYDEQKSTLCAIGDAMLEEWTLHRALISNNLEQATEALLKSSDCESEGGEIIPAQRNDTAADISLCEFSDGSIIELQTLQGGAQARQNQPLIKLILKAQKQRK